MRRTLSPRGLTLAVCLGLLSACEPDPPEPSTERARNVASAERASEDEGPADPDEPPSPQAGETADGPAPPGDSTAEPGEGEELEGCDHPLIAAGRAQVRVYRWSQSDQDRSAEMRLRPRGTRALPDGERAVRWAVRVRAEDDDSELAEAELTTRCTPGLDAEEPWFGILERSLGLTLTDEPGRWRWPAELREGLRFEGVATFDPTGSEMRAPEGSVGPQVLRVTRRHVVERRERVAVPAGRYDAWRVRYEEQHAFGEHGETGTGTLWVAPEIGLVKATAENSEGIVQTLELSRAGG